MRLRSISAVVFAAAVVATALETAGAQPADRPDTAGNGSAALGVGVFGDQLATSLDVGIDFEHGALALGIGGRVRWLTGEGVRSEDWDDRSEVATALRYLSYARAPQGRWPGVALAAGALSDVALGHGSVIDGYTAGLDVDHRSTGAQTRIEGGRYALEGLIDDVVAPRVLAARGRIALGRFGVAVTAAGDVDAGVPVLAVDAELPTRYATPYVDVVSIPMAGGGAGLHTGVATDIDGVGARWLGRVEARAGTDGYVPGWMGPLYEVERRTRLASDRMNSTAGVGGLAELGVEVHELGRVTASYARRAGLSDQMTLRLLAPYFRGVQLGLWAATDLDRAGERAFAAEIRAQLPRGLFAVADAARLYREVDGELAPLWTATVAFGSALGF